MGQEGIDKFLESHTCNEICRWLKLPCRGGVKVNPQATRVRPAQPGTVAPGQQPQRPPPPHSAPQDAAAVEKAKRELEQERREKDALAQEKAKMEAQLQRLKQELEQQRIIALSSAGAGSNGSAAAAVGNPQEEKIAQLCGMGFERVQAQGALENSSWSVQEALEYCLASTHALDAAPDAAGGGGAARGAGPPQRAPPLQPPSQTTQSSRVDVNARLRKEWMEQKTCNQRQDAVVFAEPLGESGQELREWVGVILGPAGSVYQGGAFQLMLSFPEGYPIQPPVVRFVTKVFHPNVWARPDRKFGQICLDILDDKWSPAQRVQQVLLSILALLQEPNSDSPLDKMVGEMYMSNRRMFDETAKEYMRDDCFEAEGIKNMMQTQFSVKKIVGSLRKMSNNSERALDHLLNHLDWEPSPQELLSPMVRAAAAPGVGASMRVYKCTHLLVSGRALSRVCSGCVSHVSQ